MTSHPGKTFRHDTARHSESSHPQREARRPARLTMLAMVSTLVVRWGINSGKARFPTNHILPMLGRFLHWLFAVQSVDAASLCPVTIGRMAKKS
jgi:hypothetical protein